MFNEAPNVQRVTAAVCEQLQDSGYELEILCIDDGSSDGTDQALVDAAAADPRIIPITLSRNFGKEAAMLAGLTACTGSAVILLDADLQHPPSLIPDMLAKWEQGFDVVDAVKANRGKESLVYRAFTEIFYGLLGRSIGDQLRGSSDFKLLDRQVIDAVLAMPERARFFRGMVAWVGFRVAKVPFAVQPRAAGQTSWSPFGLIRYSIRTLLSFSSAPLRAVAGLGFLTVLLDVGLAVQTLVNWIRGQAVDGFTTVILTTTLLGGLILLAIGIVAIYLGQVYDELKQRPTYIIRRPRD